MWEIHDSRHNRVTHVTALWQSYSYQHNFIVNVTVFCQTHSYRNMTTDIRHNHEQNTKSILSGQMCCGYDNFIPTVTIRTTHSHKQNIVVIVIVLWQTYSYRHNTANPFTQAKHCTNCDSFGFFFGSTDNWSFGIEKVAVKMPCLFL